jgi:DUF1365 family protein
MSAAGSQLLVGRVVHHRLAPRRHGFAHRLFMLGLDLDELPALDRRLRLFGTRRWKPVRLAAGDHLGLAGTGPAAEAVAARLRAELGAVLAAHGVADPLGGVRLIAHARIAGYVFNPVSFFVCRRAGDDAPLAVVADVHNTSGERHAYVLPAAAALAPGQWAAKKVFHVSPFFTLDGTYRFACEFGPDAVDVRIDLHRDGAPVFTSRLTLDAAPLDDAALGRALLRFPFMTAQVIGAIHWQALRLWRRGLVHHDKPPYDPAAARLTRP